MLTCKEISELASKNLDAPLTWREHVGLRLHLLVCKLCRRYVRNLRLLHQLITETAQADLESQAVRVKLSEAGRARILRALEEADRA